MKELENIENSVENRFKRWRNIRLTIICSMMCLESYLNNYLNNSDIAVNLKKTGLEEKMRKVLKTSSQEALGFLQEFSTCKRIRNGLVHYAGEIDLYKDGLTHENARKAVDMVRGLIRLIHVSSGSACPEWIEQKEPREI